MFACDICGVEFPTQLALNGHRSHCKGNRPKTYTTPTRKNAALEWSDIPHLKQVVAESVSKAEVIKKMGGDTRGGYYRMFNRLVVQHSIDTSHFLGQGHLKGKTHSNTPKLDLHSILVCPSPYPTSKLKLRLVSEGVMENKCSECGMPPEWNGKPLTLQLDHINGDCWDHRLENLRILCPNCHAQTPTFGNKSCE